MWAFESRLKELYGTLLGALDGALADSVLHTRRKALSTAHALLRSRPEGEQRLLPMVVNKLGDPERKVAGEAASRLLLLCERHPAMRGTVVAEVEVLLRRRNIAVRAVYYAVTFMNQLRLRRDGGAQEEELAAKLISIYFGQFEVYFAAAHGTTNSSAAAAHGTSSDAP